MRHGEPAAAPGTPASLLHLGLPAHSARQIDMAGWPDFVRLVEASGFDALWHSNERFYRDMFVRMTVSTTVTSTLGIGAAVVDGYAVNPVITAQAVATLQELSSGRIAVAVGAGGSGLRQLGVHRTGVAVTVRDTIRALADLLAGNRVSMQTEAFTLHDAALSIDLDARPALWVASRGQRTLALCADTADGVMLATQAGPAGAAQLLGWAGGLSTERRTMLRVDTCVHPDERVARDGCRLMVANVLRSSAPDRGFLGELADLVPESVDEAIASGEASRLQRACVDIPDALVLAMCWAGSPQSVADQVLAVANVTGITEFGFWLMPAPGQAVTEGLDLLSTVVLPTIRRSMKPR